MKEIEVKNYKYVTIHTKEELTEYINHLKLIDKEHYLRHYVSGKYKLPLIAEIDGNVHQGVVSTKGRLNTWELVKKAYEDEYDQSIRAWAYINPKKYPEYFL